MSVLALKMSGEEAHVFFKVALCCCFFYFASGYFLTWVLKMFFFWPFFAPFFQFFTLNLVKQTHWWLCEMTPLQSGHVGNSLLVLSSGLSQVSRRCLHE